MHLWVTIEVFKKKLGGGGKLNEGIIISGVSINMFLLMQSDFFPMGAGAGWGNVVAQCSPLPSSHVELHQPITYIHVVLIFFFSLYHI